MGHRWGSTPFVNLIGVHHPATTDYFLRTDFDWHEWRFHEGARPISGLETTTTTSTKITLRAAVLTVARSCGFQRLAHPLSPCVRTTLRRQRQRHRRHRVLGSGAGGIPRARRCPARQGHCRGHQHVRRVPRTGRRLQTPGNRAALAAHRGKREDGRLFHRSGSAPRCCKTLYERLHVRFDNVVLTRLAQSNLVDFREPGLSTFCSPGALGILRERWT